MNRSFAWTLSAVLAISACAPAVSQPTVTPTPVPSASPTVAPTNTPRPSPTPDYPLSIQTPVPNLQVLTLDNAAHIRPVSSLVQPGSAPLMRLASSGRLQPPWVFNSDFTQMAFVGEREIQLTDISGSGINRTQTIRMPDKDYPWSDAAFLKDNHLLVLGQGTLSLFDLAGGNEIKKVELYCCLDKEIFLLPDGERALIPSRTGLDLYDVTRLKRIHGFDAPGNSTLVWEASPDGTLLAAAGERNPSVFIFDVERAVVLQTLKVERFPAVNVKFLPDGKQLLLTDELGTFGLLQFWDTRTGKKIREIQLTAEMFGLPAGSPVRVASLAVHPSGKFFVMAISSSEPLLAFWETGADTPATIVNAKQYGVSSFNYSTKTEFLEFPDPARLLVVDTLWGVLP